MKKKLLLAALSLALLLCAGIALAEPAFGTAVIRGGNSDRVHLRKAASQDAASLGLYFTGTRVTCNSDPAGEWVSVTVGSESGYMYGAYLAQGETGVTSKQPIGVVRNRSDSWVNVRQRPTTNAAALTTATNGTRVTIWGETSTDWYLVEIDDFLGYIRADLLSITSDISNEIVFASGGGPTPSPALGVSANLQAVLAGTMPFFSTENNRNMTISELHSINDSANRYTQFAVADLNADGTPEIILGGSEYYDSYEVLHQAGEIVCSYTLVYRAFLVPKADGTFSFSSGAADNGFGTMSFDDTYTSPLEEQPAGPRTDGAYHIVERTYCESAFDQNNQFTILYFVDYRPATKEEYDAAREEQDKKQNLVWYAMTRENIEALR